MRVSIGDWLSSFEWLNLAEICVARGRIRQRARWALGYAISFEPVTRHSCHIVFMSSVTQVPSATLLPRVWLASPLRCVSRMPLHDSSTSLRVLANVPLYRVNEEPLKADGAR